jgi:recombination protein RecR
MAFWILKNPNSLPQAITDLKDLKVCDRCRSLICLCDGRKDQNKLAVVEDDLDLIALERSGIFQGIYHVIGKEIKIDPTYLLKQIKDNSLDEIIIATNPTTEGDVIALKLKKVISEKFPKLKVTRLARGLPTGGDIQYADERTLGSALLNRGEI